METVLKAISDWIKSLLTAAIMSNLNGLFDDVNTQVGSIAQQVGTKPSSFEPRVFAMIEALSRNVVLPIAGVILTFIACYELIQLITEHNNMAQFEPALLMKWIFKTAISVWMISNTFDIIMAVFDVTQQVGSFHAAIQHDEHGRRPPVRVILAVLLYRYHHAHPVHCDFCHRLRKND